MRVENFLSIFKSALSPEECDKIIKYGLSQKLTKATVNSINPSLRGSVRDSEIVWLYDPWILDLIMPYVERANKETGWNFQFRRPPALQFAKYGKGQFYDWHRDTLPLSYALNVQELYGLGGIRKLSVTVNLNDDYEGGGMFFDNEIEYGKTNAVSNEVGRPKGSICVFPSDVWHKVDKVTKGTRYSLVIWLKGNQWV